MNDENDGKTEKRNSRAVSRDADCNGEEIEDGERPDIHFLQIIRLH